MIKTIYRCDLCGQEFNNKYEAEQHDFNQHIKKSYPQYHLKAFFGADDDYGINGLLWSNYGCRNATSNDDSYQEFNEFFKSKEKLLDYIIPKIEYMIKNIHGQCGLKCTVLSGDKCRYNQTGYENKGDFCHHYQNGKEMLKTLLEGLNIYKTQLLGEIYSNNQDDEDNNSNYYGYYLINSEDDNGNGFRFSFNGNSEVDFIIKYIEAINKI